MLHIREEVTNEWFDCLSVSVLHGYSRHGGGESYVAVVGNDIWPILYICQELLQSFITRPDFNGSFLGFGSIYRVGARGATVRAIFRTSA